MAELFDYIKSINGKDYIFDEMSKKDYNPFMVGQGFSYYMDTVLLANEINQYPNISNKSHYDYLYYSVSKKKRFAKWNKKEATPGDLQLVMDYFKFSAIKAKEALLILTKDQIEEIRSLMNKGGK